MPEHPTIPTVHGRWGTIPLIGSDGSLFDPDAQGFFTRAGITDSTQKNAVNDLVRDLKAASLWAIHDVIYPFVGGTASTHSYNLKSSSYQITWSGTLTHNSSGVRGNGTNGYGNTGFIPNASIMTSQNASYSEYINLADTTGGASMGTPTSGAAVDVMQFFTNLSGNTYYVAMFGTDSGKIQGANGPGTTGMFTCSRFINVNLDLYKDGSNVLSNEGSGPSEGGPPSLATFIFARNNAGTATNFSDQRKALVMMGGGLSSGSAETLATINSDFQIALGRL